jgi:hypothetical protein
MKTRRISRAVIFGAAKKADNSLASIEDEDTRLSFDT